MLIYVVVLYQYLHNRQDEDKNGTTDLPQYQSIQIQKINLERTKPHSLTYGSA